jgi:predicted XRE-type DNA-binding protein
MKEIITEETKKVLSRRKEVAEKIAIFERITKTGVSQRQIAQELEIPRATLQHWIKRKENIVGEKALIELLESPTGLIFLHQVVMAAQFVITQVGVGGIRLVCQFLELSGLDKFVGSSYGSQQKVNQEMQKAIAEYSKEETKRLSQEMKPKKISICQDETFHEQTCLVAIEPVSNFILVEKYAQARDKQNWDNALSQAIEGMKVEVIQSTSDQAKGILAHVNNGLGVHHSPDLFHIERDLTLATSASLNSQKRKTEKQYSDASIKLEATIEQKAQYQNSGATNNLKFFEQGVKQAQELKLLAHQQLEEKLSNLLKVTQAIKAISLAYHPYDLETGAKICPENLESSLLHQFREIEQVAITAGLSDESIKKIAKARKLLPQMLSTFGYFFQMCKEIVEAQSLTLELEEILYQMLIPAFYLKKVSEKLKDPKLKQSSLATATILLALATSKHYSFSFLPEEQQLSLFALAKECSNLFQRSSSCVEGRNGQLSLRHHSFHQLSNSKLLALTTVHNFFIKRQDGSTAAQRFFAQKPRDLFSWLLEHVHFPARPAKKRSLLALAS